MKAIHALVVAAALPILGGAGSCGILFDLWSWDEINEHADRLVLHVEEGVVEVAGYPRTGAWLQRHVYAFEASLGQATYGVEDGVLEVVFDCDGPATCFADHWLEIPDTMPVEMHIGEGAYSLIGLGGRTVLTVDQGSATAADLRARQFSLEGDLLGETSLAWSEPPDSISVRAGRGDVVLTLPAGVYACQLDVPDPAFVAATIVCDPEASAVIAVELDEGTLQVQAAE